MNLKPFTAARAAHAAAVKKRRIAQFCEAGLVVSCSATRVKGGVANYNAEDCLRIAICEAACSAGLTIREAVAELNAVLADMPQAGPWHLQVITNDAIEQTIDGSEIALAVNARLAQPVRRLVLKAA